MLRKILGGIIALIVMVTVFYCAKQLMGSGAFKRHITFSGIYSAPCPDNFDCTCFSEADSDSAPSCLPNEWIKKVKKP